MKDCWNGEETTLPDLETRGTTISTCTICQQLNEIGLFAERETKKDGLSLPKHT